MILGALLPRLCDVHVQGMSVRQMVQDTDMSLHAYLAGVRWRLWASPIEVCLAAKILEMPIAVAVKGSLVCYGNSPKHVVKLRDQHYTLYTMKRKPMRASTLHQDRGGNEAWPMDMGRGDHSDLNHLQTCTTPSTSRGDTGVGATEYTAANSRCSTRRIILTDALCDLSADLTQRQNRCVIGGPDSEAWHYSATLTCSCG